MIRARHILRTVRLPDEKLMLMDSVSKDLTALLKSKLTD
jgi:hypothetical protein